jgi:prepilin-type N-terminal cleavage/methylation domain-containing protein
MLQDGQFSRRQRGLTLLELLVVLMILATLGTVMVTQTMSLTNEARYDQTVRMLEQIRDGLSGRVIVSGEDPSAVLPGFVVDMGRLPEGPDLSELWVQGALADFDLHDVSAAFDDVTPDALPGIAGGWRRPYVRLPVGAAELTDGWGQVFDVQKADGTAAAAGEEIRKVVSDGSGITGDPYNVTLDDVDYTDDDLISGPISFELTFTLAASDNAVVRLYGPLGADDGLPGVVAQQGFAATGTGSAQTETVNFGGQRVRVGPKVLRVYQWDDPDPPTDRTDPDAKWPGVGFRSEIRRVTVPPGGGPLENWTVN